MIEIAIKAAKAAGDVLMSHFGKLKNIRYKSSFVDLVTDADIEAEKMIIEIISSKFPEHSILSEESGQNGVESTSCWIIDPLDGTTNFTHCVPFFGISIAYTENRDTLLGVVYDPYHDELFSGTRGKGAFLNDSLIAVSTVPSVRESLLATGFPNEVCQNPDPYLGTFREFLCSAQGVRRPGSAALDLAYVAWGRFDGFWEEGLKPWDTAAGCLLVQEAGGRVTNYDGEHWNPFSPHVVASNGFVHSEMCDIINKRR